MSAHGAYHSHLSPEWLLALHYEAVPVTPHIEQQLDIVLSTSRPFLSSLLLAASTMSSTFQVAASSSSPNFQLIFSAALKAYEKQTKRDLLAHPLASQLQTCDSIGSILAVLKGQVDDLDHARKSDERLTKWLNPTVNVLLAFSATLGEGISLVSAQGDIVL